MIVDRELRSIFIAESEEHLHRLEEGLLLLEATPKDYGTLEELFREAHSLKGSAGTLGLTKVQTITHQFEDMLGAAKRGSVPLTKETIDRMCRAIDILRRLVYEAVSGVPGDIDISSILTQLGGENSGSSLERNDDTNIEKGRGGNESTLAVTFTPSTGAGGTISRGIGAYSREPENQENSASASSEIHNPESTPDDSKLRASRLPFKIETIRVEPHKLDLLMRHAGELAVTKVRVSCRVAEIEELQGLWEECSRSVRVYRSLSGEVERHHMNDTAGNLSRLQEQGQGPFERLGDLINRLKAGAAEDGTRLNFVANELEEGIRAIRLLPLSTIFNLLPRMVRDLARDQSKEVRFVVEGAEIAVDKRILEEMKDPLIHIIRNSVDHGVELPEERERRSKPRIATIRLKAKQTAKNIVIEVEDDGQGVDIESIKRMAVKRRICSAEELEAMTKQQVESLIFASGFSTSTVVTDVSGRGVGLDVVRTNVERLKGTLEVESNHRVGCTIRVQLPITLSTARVLLVAVDHRTYALPVEFVYRACLVSGREIFTMSGRETIVFEGQSVSVVWLSDLLEIQTAPPAAPFKGRRGSETVRPLPCVLLSVGGDRLGLLVDMLLDEREVVLKPKSALLKRVRNVAGSTILGTGEVCVVLNPQDLMKSLLKRQWSVPPEKQAEDAPRKPVILLVEDSMTTRTQEKRILESAGYEVVTAVNGIDGWGKLSASTLSFDAVVSDVQMPVMDGLVLTEKIRQDSKYKELPIILVTSLASEEDRKKGIEVGANAYITKRTFDQKVLLDTLGRLV